MGGDLIDRAAAFFRDLQQRITDRLAALDGAAGFREDAWQREGGGGGFSRVLEGGALFEKAGVNWSDVEGELGEDFADKLPGAGRRFRASGVSLVLHPASPMVPTVHANFRCIDKGGTTWLGGGADLTPSYAWAEDAIHFHRAWKTVCDRHDPTYYSRFKKTCDEYFYLPHRREMRGVGGIFFDYLTGDLEALDALWAFVRDAGETFLPAYCPIAERRRGEPFGEEERRFQLYRRGRYAEFNLLYDRGTVFGLKTGGRIESILMSLPPLAAWPYDFQPAPGSREVESLSFLQPRDWV